MELNLQCEELGLVLPNKYIADNKIKQYAKNIHLFEAIHLYHELWSSDKTAHIFEMILQGFPVF